MTHEKFIEKRDGKWHTMDEITPTTTTVIFEIDSKEVEGEIVVEMCGVFYYRRKEPTGWINSENISRWRFLTVEEIRETNRGLKTK